MTTHAERKLLRQRACEWCGATFEVERPSRIAKFCSRLCSANYGASIRGVMLTEEQKQTARYERTYREVDAPGLNRRARSKLLHKWIRQGKCCAYCNSKVKLTVDHVVPLVLGGTNHIGNLTPCCKVCNSSKAHRLLIEWKYGRPARKTLRQQQRSVPRPKTKKQRPKLPKVYKPCGLCGTVPTEGKVRKYCGNDCMAEANRRLARARYYHPATLRDCAICSRPAASTRQRYCSDECRIEQGRRVRRDRYRRNLGLPVNPQQPTSKWELAA